jgi:hypothetical protein
LTFIPVIIRVELLIPTLGTEIPLINGLVVLGLLWVAKPSTTLYGGADMILI